MDPPEVSAAAARPAGGAANTAWVATGSATSAGVVAAGVGVGFLVGVGLGVGVPAALPPTLDVLAPRRSAGRPRSSPHRPRPPDPPAPRPGTPPGSGRRCSSPAQRRICRRGTGDPHRATVTGDGHAGPASPGIHLYPHLICGNPGKAQPQRGAQQHTPVGTLYAPRSRPCRANRRRRSHPRPGPAPGPSPHARGARRPPPGHRAAHRRSPPASPADARTSPTSTPAPAGAAGQVTTWSATHPVTERPTCVPHYPSRERRRRARQRRGPGWPGRCRARCAGAG